MNTQGQTQGSFTNSLSGAMKALFQTKGTSSTPVSSQTSISQSTAKDSKETYHAWGVRWSGNAGANQTALSPALQSCYTQNVNEQNNNQAKQQQNQQNINSQIQTKKGERAGEVIKLDSKNREKNRLQEDVKTNHDKIDDIKSGDGKNIMAKVQFGIGAIITVLLAVYLFVFYSSASFSAFFGNDDISGAGDAILDSHCYAEALANGLGQLLFILLMPVIFLGLGFLIHQFGESENGFGKYVKILSLYIVTFIFDSLLAFEISQKVYEYTLLTEEQYTVSMAFNSPNFWVVIFAGFVAYVIWGLVFDATLQHFDSMNAHTKEIKVLEGKIKIANQKIDEIDTEISKIQQKINSLDTDIATLNTQLQSRTLIDTNELKKALSEFFSGWIAYMNLAAKPQSEKDMASQTYNIFISRI